MATNLEVTGGEIDILARDGSDLVAVEVRTRHGAEDPIDAVDTPKRHRVAALASAVGEVRADFVGVGLDDDAFVIHWVPG